VGLALVAFLLGLVAAVLGLVLIAAVAVGFCWAIRRDRPGQAVLRWLRRHPAPPIGFVAIGAMLCSTWVLPQLLAATTHEATHISYEQAAKLPGLGHLPSGATDINYHYSYLLTYVDFLVNEKGFAEWCKTNGWTPTDAQQASPPRSSYRMPCGGWNNDDAVEIRNGLVCDRRSHRGGTAVAYDRDSGRAYLFRSHN
jgi:hypothetical protein